MDQVGELLHTLGRAVSVIWESATSPVAPLPLPITLITGAVALLVVLWGATWRVARHAITIAHEGFHGVAAVTTGRSLRGIRLHSDTSGLTLSRGRPRGIGMVVTLLAGYPGPALAGLCSAWLVHRGYPMAMLWLFVALLCLLLLQIRNLFGLWSVAVSTAVLVTVSWWAPADVRGAVAATVAWFLLLGAVRPVLELQRSRRRGAARTSDADQLAALTHLPGILWVGVFLAFCLAALAIGGFWLLGDPRDLALG
ncbi:M50 family metallopeptidase [Microbacterium oryzae]|uniref:M50 family metallopeptidase n=1 Tax=Microbacterium oryzae TaxID=743009 RepID=UPI0025B21BDD|nr:M50 family metallopeptidase [Microbacterium oryzae]MDN3311315.1 M50 family metallopeptidase [Microbacterium oryzae]